MPTCVKCDESFKNFVTVDGKSRNLSRRKYCLTCSPFGQHNTLKIHDPDVMNPNRTCLNCGRPFTYKGKKNNTANHRKDQCNSCRATKFARSRKAQEVEYKGGKCIRCGYDKCLDVLMFHHRDPTVKSFTISTNHSRRWEVLKEELDKCDLLCLNCHGETHAEMNDASFHQRAECRD